MRWLGVGALVVGLAASGANAQTFAPSAATSDAFAPLSAVVFNADRAAPVEWRGNELTWRNAGSNDHLTLNLGGTVRGADGLPALRPQAGAAFEAEGFDFSLTRDWPSAVRFAAGESRFAITPHAGLAVTDAGGGAQAGATLSLEDRMAGRLRGLGLRDGSTFGDRGRWYMFAAASGRSVGLNMLRGEDGGYHRAGWSTDATSALVSDAQAGIGWRRGPLQASLGYIHREIKPRNGLMGLESKDDDLVAFTFSFKPR